MEQNEEAVNEEEVSAASNEQVVEQQQEQVNEQQNQEQTQAQGQVPLQAQVDERGVDYKNVAMEYRRKLEEVPTLIERTVQQVLEKTQNQTNKPQEYTVAQLEQFAMDNPGHRPWVEEQKALLIQKNIEKSQEERFQAVERQRTEAQIRQQTEQWVTTHPKFKDCFVTDVYGNKQWNMNNQLTQLMSSMLNQIDPVTGKAVKDRPDGLAVAARMAYGEFALNSEPKAQSSMKQLQKELRKTQKQTMVVGQGVSSSSGNMTDYQKHAANYNKSYSPKDAQAMTKSYLKSIGLIKENQE
jgi:hypothetical protein